MHDKRLLQLARAQRLPLLLTVACGLGGCLVIITQAHLLAQVIDRAFLGHSALAGVGGLLGILLLAALVRAGLAWGAEVAAQRTASQVKQQVRIRLLARLLALGPAFVRGERTGELVNTATRGIEELDAWFSQLLPQAALAMLAPVAILCAVFPIDPLSGLVLLLTAPLIPIFMALIGSLAGSLSRRQWVSLSRMSAHFLDVLQGLTTLKLFGRSQRQTKIIARISDDYRRATMRVLRVAFLSALVLELVATVSTAVVAVEVGLRLLAGTLTFGRALFVLLLAPEFYQPLRALGARYHAAMSGTSAADRIFAVIGTGEDHREDGEDEGSGRTEARRPMKELYNLQRTLPGGRGRRLKAAPKWPASREARLRGLAAQARPLHTVKVHDGGGNPGPAQGVATSTVLPSVVSQDICLVDVAFTYPGGQAPALDGVTCEIAGGMITALVGPSGAGKSTLANLLLRFQLPDAGRILVGGVSLDEIGDAAWREQIAWVPQRPHLFHTTVAENIRLARPDAPLEAVIAAARAAEAHDFIQALPQGYETPVGEHGARLSGGQVQRIALARAFLRAAPLLICDEATSHLDPESEALVTGALRRLAAGRTVLIIAHRLSTVCDADRILVLDHGRVVAAGTHETLLATDPLYRSLVLAHGAAA